MSLLKKHLINALNGNVSQNKNGITLMEEVTLTHAFHFGSRSRSSQGGGYLVGDLGRAFLPQTQRGRHVSQHLVHRRVVDAAAGRLKRGGQRRHRGGQVWRN